ncbi:undecaprenyldiphospho-muramoylpentapeptide beta-N-acetylglucosaminyltransferase [Cohnella sp. CIP 111063]|uniref:undecaprenyldiphospho-muramoylpentapeptide beta-N-acetylglucosaminyltransferase n=1 Tax=unclassified Cohnella TaxID=2636738 RepID=UPI000B8BFC11|nr:MULTISPECIES: undecaprenyldiphospho-muramoylpentapeptide beta-N-acetylglucosaminyltransferase [unclassified Cohnella]OXS62438.1 undecaprenyldiphospho-muramoylpentapeptide beta-N-acetylglucosaminyltransferase [Cohnella sp. CIP 111063]PRX74678.1 UDP-N-acetylglucosamine-N-acetylmuramylpentapeptide N-acetylglucosamine transferase [Cohnella sp. SGD-V74]
MRVVLTGGGTGGHIYPALAIGREISERHPGTSLLYIGTSRGLEGRIVPEQGIAFENITITGFRRSLSLENVKTVMRFLKGVSRSKELLRKFKPDVVVGTGGYVCGPVVYAASRLGIPTLIHEQNVLPGLTNKFLSRYVDGVAVSFKESEKQFAKCPDVVYAGNPCATRVLKADGRAGFASLGFAPGTPFALIVGGSGGARALNEAFVRMLPLIGKLPDVRFVFVTGERFYKETESAVAGSSHAAAGRVKVLPYIANMPDVLAAASLYVGRAGASFLAEVTSLGLPSLLVPSPNVTNNHQEANARSLMNAGAADMILERELSGETLFAGISGILGDQARRQAMASASRSLGMPESASIIYEQIARLQRKR